MLALRDLMRQVATTYAATPCLKRTIQTVVAILVWLVNAIVVGSFLQNEKFFATALVFVLGLIFVWTPGMIAYAWATTPSADKAKLPIERSRTALYYDKFFGLNGTVGEGAGFIRTCSVRFTFNIPCRLRRRRFLLFPLRRLQHTTLGLTALRAKGPSLADGVRCASGLD